MLQSAAVDTPLGVDSDLSVLTLLGTLGGDHNHTVGTTGTIQSVRSSILQHSHVLDIGRVQIGHIAIVRSTVDNDKRILTSVQ